MAQATRPLHLAGVGTARRHHPISPRRLRPTGRRRTAALVAVSAAKGAAADVVREFYDGVNRRDLAAVSLLIAEGCVYEDLVFPRPMVGRDRVVAFFGDFMGSVSPDLRFVIDDISGEDPAAVGVTWHLEWKGRPFPFSRGCSFYRMIASCPAAFGSEREGIVTAKELQPLASSPSSTPSSRVLEPCPDHKLLRGAKRSGLGDGLPQFQFPTDKLFGVWQIDASGSLAT